MDNFLRCTLLAALLLFLQIFLPFRGVSAETNTATTPTIQLPLDVQAYKIEIDANGIYALTYADLQAAGMPVDSVNPNSFEMMTRGQTVAYQFIGNNNAVFEPNEALLFYGWAFDGSKPEAQYVSNNVFWLWADGTPTTIETAANVVNGTVVESVSAEATTQPENFFSTTYTNLWTGTPNEFDPWYWEKIVKTNNLPKAVTYTIDVPHVAPQADPAFLTVELVSQSKIDGHLASASLNGSQSITYTWDGKTNVNITGTVPYNLLDNGTNDIELSIDTPQADSMLLNRITVRYLRALTTDNDTLQFAHDTGSHTYQLDQFSESNPNNVLAWNISDRHAPQAVVLTAADITASGGAYQYRVGATTSTETNFFVTTASNLQPAKAISRYTATNIEPNNGADWVAISHALFETEAWRLAQYRANQSQLTTHVIDVEDVINQYGFGLPLPHGIQDYLKHAMADWATPPNYVVLIGDATMNPRQQECPLCSSWSTAESTYVPTFLQPHDRSLGMIPTDHGFSTLVGDDDLPDVSIGRLPVSSIEGMAALVDKIIQYEANLGSAADWNQNQLFVADNVDAAGPFCAHNDANMDKFSAEFEKTRLCLDETPITDLRTEMFDTINDGIFMLTYLGHGFIDGWASEGILTESDLTQFTNADRPYVQISGNCLDGHFAWPGVASMSETLLQLEGGGVAAHWGATGLGYLYEHKVLHDKMYEGLLEEGHTAIGDAIRYSKEHYLQTWFYYGQAYSSVLLGDPAMQLMQPDVGVTTTADQPYVNVGETIHFEIEVTNHGNLPAEVNLANELPNGVEIINTVVPLSAQVATAFTQTVPNRVDFYFSDTLAPGQSVIVGVQARVTDSGLLGRSIAGVATASGSGFDANPANDSGSVLVGVGFPVPTAVSLDTINASHPNNRLSVLVATALLTLCTGKLNGYAIRRV